VHAPSPAIPQNKLVVLEDPKNNFLAANVVPLVASLIDTKLAGATSRPYFALRPGRPSVRLWNSDGPPNFTSAECAARSPMVLRFHFLAVASVTATVSWSLAGDGVRIDRSPGSTRCNASSTALGSVALVCLSKYCSRLPVYSGMRSME
jgi:hypothetical protein